MEPDQTQHDRSASCIIAQQYSSVTAVVLRPHTRKENYGARFNNVIISISVLFKIQTPDGPGRNLVIVPLLPFALHF